MGILIFGYGAPLGDSSPKPPKFSCDREKARKPDKSGHLSVEPGAFCHFLSGLCPVLSEECLGFVRFCHPWNAGESARRVWVRKFFRSHFVPFHHIGAGSVIALENFLRAAHFQAIEK